MMIQTLRKILSKIIVATFVVTISVPVFAATSNLPGMPDIGDHGQWLTENNRSAFVGELSSDIGKFQGDFQNQLVQDYVPIEAKVGLAFMNGMSFVAKILDSSLVRFMEIFIIIAFAFWIMLEAYKMMTDGKGKVQELLMGILKKGTKISIWIIVLHFGPAKIFMWVMGPIITISTYMSDLILNSVAQSAGANLPDTCAAIREYAMTHISADNIIDPRAAADIMCVPTRMSGFCYTAIAAGWEWINFGIGTSLFTVGAGVTFIVAFLLVAWRFAFIALGVIADLFLGVMMLPFTAVAETVNKTSYKGIVGNIYNGFLAIFNTESLSAQISRFIQAAIYFVSLSIVIAFCAAMLSGVFDSNLASNIPTLENQDFLTTLLVVLLTWWFANKASQIASDLGGKIDSSVGTKIQKDAKDYWKAAKKQYKSWSDAIKESRKAKSS